VKKKTVKKKTPKKKNKTARDKAIEQKHDWLTEEEIPMELRNQFPEDIIEVDQYIQHCQNVASSHAPSFDVEDEIKTMKSYRYGWAVGWHEGVESVLDKVRQVQKERQAMDDEKVNNLSNKKVFDYLEKEDPEKKIPAKKLIEVSKVTKKELLERGIRDTDRYLHKTPEQERFDNWWVENYGYDRRKGIMTLSYESIDCFNGLQFGSWWSLSFEDFDQYIHNYCYNRKRVGFWEVDTYGHMTFHFDVLNKEELNEKNRERKILEAKQLLESEGIIERVEPPEPDYSTGI